MLYSMGETARHVYYIIFIVCPMHIYSRNARENQNGRGARDVEKENQD